jgi:hypothetical protein
MDFLVVQIEKKEKYADNSLHELEMVRCLEGCAEDDRNFDNNSAIPWIGSKVKVLTTRLIVRHYQSGINMRYFSNRLARSRDLSTSFFACC